MDIQGAGSSTGVGLYNSGLYSAFVGVVRGFNGVGGKGVQIQDGTYSSYDLTVRDCETVLTTAGDYTHSHLRLRGFSAAGSTLWSGAPTVVQRATMHIDVAYKVGTTSYSSKHRSSNAGIDVATAATYTITVPHGLAFAPSPQDVRLSLSYSGSNFNWRVTPPFVVSTDATNVVVRVTVTTTITSPAVQPQLLVAIDL